MSGGREGPDAAALLRALAEEADFQRALGRFPGLAADDARRLLAEAAARLEVPAAPAPKSAPASKRGATGGQAALFDASASATRAAGGTAPPAPTEAHVEATPRRRSSTGRVRVFSDGAARGNPGPSGAGAVIQDASGEILARLGRYLGRTTNNVAEYEGLLLGLRHALELGAKEVQVVADSELLVKQLRGQYKVKAPHLKALYDQARGLLARFERHEVRHVLRAENGAADQMANRAIDERLAD